MSFTVNYNMTAPPKLVEIGGASKVSVLDPADPSGKSVGLSE